MLKSRNLLQKLHYSSVLAASGVCFGSFCGVDVGGVMLSSVKVCVCVCVGGCACVGKHSLLPQSRNKQGEVSTLVRN